MYGNGTIGIHLSLLRGVITIQAIDRPNMLLVYRNNITLA